ncbi:MAG: hypothetical protein CL758_00765 [Chloroflexi bacterium]|nr:hypothetical protein [Chloroflexota bacterium]|tara:strand:- start:7754 stop:8224 length:471 start_codon:yes stop_codon:yes gene_type:complete
MVTPVAKPIISTLTIPSTHPIQPEEKGIEKSKVLCPRCNSKLRITYYEPQCIQCGFVDYEYKENIKKSKNVVNSGTKYVLRYYGEAESLNNTLVNIELYRLGNRAVYNVTCPFCTTKMEQTSLSGKRRDMKEERYKCEKGHRVSLKVKEDGGLGWK